MPRIFTAAMLIKMVRNIAFSLFFSAPLLNAFGAEPISPSNPGILILRNGSTIEGRITPSGKMFIVDLGDGEIRLKAEDVETICTDLEDGYRKKRATIQVGNVHHHLDLALWCIRHQLLGHAAEELADAKAADPNHRMIGVVEHRLKMAAEPVQLVAHEESVEGPKTGPTNEELDRMVRNLPRGAVESFTQTVQPLLLNSCATSGCHGPQSETALRLLRVPFGKAATRRITQRNLYSVLQYVDRENPAASSLLKVSGGPHGSLKRSDANKLQTESLEPLSQWVNRLALNPPPQTPATVNPVSPFDFQEPPPVQAPPQVLSDDARKAQPISKTNSAESARNTGSLGHAPADPFDPEAFNQQYAPAQTPPEASSSSKEAPSAQDAKDR